MNYTFQVSKYSHVDIDGFWMGWDNVGLGVDLSVRMGHTDHRGGNLSIRLLFLYLSIDLYDERHREHLGLSDAQYKAAVAKEEADYKAEKAVDHHTIAVGGTCSICDRPYNGYGNNAEPVNDGRCCDGCNATVVIPARLQRLGL